MVDSLHIVMVVYVLILIMVYVLIITEVVHKSIAALIGAVIGGMIGVLFNLFDAQDIVMFVDFRTLGIIIGVMILVEVSRTSGIFQFIALRAIKASGYNPKRLFVIFCFLTAFLGGIIGNITTMLIVGTLTVLVLIPLRIDPVPFLIAEAIITDIGSLMTLIGNVPAILISRSAGWTFFQFTTSSMPFSIALVSVVINILLFRFKNEIPKEFKTEVLVLEEMDPWAIVPDKKLFWKSLAMLALTIILFMTYDKLGLTLEIVAMLGGILLLFERG